MLVRNKHSKHGYTWCGGFFNNQVCYNSIYQVISKNCVQCIICKEEFYRSFNVEEEVENNEFIEWASC